MKRILIVIALIVLLSIPAFAQSQYNFLGLGIIGLSNTTLGQLAGNEAQFFDSAVWGINGRLKFSKFFGVAFDLFYVGTQYYWTYDYSSWYGPAPWTIAGPIVTEATGYDQDTWQYYHDEFYLNMNIGIYLPIAFLQLYFECGPSFFFTQVSDVYDTGFQDYYDDIYGNGGFTVGLNFKIGLDLFLTRSISIGAFIYFLEPSFESFITGMQGNTSEYIMNRGYVGLELMFWL